MASASVESKGKEKFSQRKMWKRTAHFSLLCGCYLADKSRCSCWPVVYGWWQFILEHHNWTAEQWEEVVWSDESSFSLHNVESWGHCMSLTWGRHEDFLEKCKRMDLVGCYAYRVLHEPLKHCCWSLSTKCMRCYMTVQSNIWTCQALI